MIYCFSYKGIVAFVLRLNKIRRLNTDQKGDCVDKKRVLFVGYKYINTKS